MLMVSMFVANLSNATGLYWWSIVIVVFLLLNKLCYDYELNSDEDDDEYEWLGDDENV